MPTTSLRALALTALAFASVPSAPRAAEPSGQGDRAPVSTDLDGKGGTLSDKLGDTNGVIHPQGDVDPSMRKPAPATGSMPVVKPGAVAPGTAK